MFPWISRDFKKFEKKNTKVKFLFTNLSKKKGKVRKILITSHSKNGGIFELNLKNEKFKKLYLEDIEELKKLKISI